MEVQCAGQKAAQFTKLQAMTGTQLNANFGSKNVPGDYVMMGLFVATGTALLLGGRKRALHVTRGIITGLSACYLIYFKMRAEADLAHATMNSGDVVIVWLAGYWLVFINYAAACAGSFWAYTLNGASPLSQISGYGRPTGGADGLPVPATASAVSLAIQQANPAPVPSQSRPVESTTGFLAPQLAPTANLQTYPEPQPVIVFKPGNDYSERMADIVALCLEKLRRVLTRSLVERSLLFFKTAGQWMVLTGAALGLVNALVIGVRYNNFKLVLTGIGAVLVVAVMQYIARLFLNACAQVNQSTACSLSSPAVPDSVSLLASLASLGILFVGVGGALVTNQFSIALYAILASALVLWLAGIALNPSLLQLKIAPASAAAEAMGVLSFFMKLPLVMMPLLYLLVAALGVLMSLGTLFGGTSDRTHDLGPLAIRD
jgi:hypothetical protein